MKFHIAFALLALFGAAQAGKQQEVMTFGSGYTENSEQPGTLAEETADYSDNVASATSELMGPSNLNAEQAGDTYGMKSKVYTASAESYQELYREKREIGAVQAKRARNLAHHANEAYKKAQLHKRTAKDKEVVAKEYEERAQKHDRLSKEQDIKEQDDYRKEMAEMGEYCNNIKRANSAVVYSTAWSSLARLEMDETNECEQHARALYAKAEEYHKMAADLKEKAKKEKELARISESKAKEEEAKSAEYENAFNEASKKVTNDKFYELEFLMKAETERYQAEYARTRSQYLKKMYMINRDHSEVVHQFANSEYKDYLLFKRRAIETSKESKVLAASATQLMKRHRSYNTEIYSKRPYPHSNYHEA